MENGSRRSWWGSVRCGSWARGWSIATKASAAAPDQSSWWARPT